MSSFTSSAPLLVFLIIFVIFIMARRIYSGINGRRFKTTRLFTIPFIYLLLLLFFLGAFIGLLDYILIIILIGIVGLIPGFAFGESVTFFEKNNSLYYKRSPLILIIWAAGFIVRLILELFYPQNLLANFIVDSLLGFTLGMIIGESIKAMKKYKQYISIAGPIN